MAEYVFKIDGEIKSCYSDVYSQDGYCPFHFYAFNGGSHCSISDCKCTKTKRPEGCPLVKIVRCKDCLYFYDETNMCELFGSWTDADGFCHKAEKKETY